MRFFDLHSDTLALVGDNDFFSPQAPINITYPKLLRGKVAVQCFAVCVPRTSVDSVLLGNEFIRRFDRITSEGNMPVILSADDVASASAQKPSALLALEGADMLAGDPDGIFRLYDKGVRLMTLTWNNSNPFAGGIGENTAGLTLLGRQLVVNCHKLGIVMDVSHLSEKSFWDLAEVSPCPIIASHSNARALCSNKRNLSDDQIKAIAHLGGTVGINLYPPFLSDSGTACLDDVIRHIEYMAALVGTEHISIGTDFDGVDNNLPRGITSPVDLPKIAAELCRLGYSADAIDAICYGNAARVFTQVL